MFQLFSSPLRNILWQEKSLNKDEIIKKFFASDIYLNQGTLDLSNHLSLSSKSIDIIATVLVEADTGNGNGNSDATISNAPSSTKVSRSSRIAATIGTSVIPDIDEDSDDNNSSDVNEQQQRIERRKIKQINCSQLIQLNDNDICKLFQSIPDKGVVESVNISNIYDLTDASINACLKHFKQLKSLSICGLTLLSQESIKAIFETYGNTLEYADISGIVHLKDSIFIDFVNQQKVFPLINFLNITGCQNLSDDGIDAITKLFPNLTTLKIAGVRDITDQSISSISALKSLKELDIRGCLRIDETRVSKKLSNTPNINIITGDMDEIDPEEVKRAIRSFLFYLASYIVIIIAIAFATDNETAIKVNFLFIGSVAAYFVLGLILLVLGSGF